MQTVILAVPGAFTPTCSLKHLPGFVEKADEIKAKGVDTIACVAVNDAFVMDAWSKSVDVGDKILMLADGSAIFTKASCCKGPNRLIDAPMLGKALAATCRNQPLICENFHGPSWLLTARVHNLCSRTRHEKL